MDLDLKTLAYEDAASSTTPPTVHTRLVRPAVVFHLLSEFVKAGKALDLYLKKPFVYGEDRVQPEGRYADLSDIDYPRDLDEREAAFAHGVVGLATESAETVELLMEMWFFNKHIEAGKVIDEAGDNLWYIVRMLRALGSDLPSAMRANVAKLTARHHKGGKTFNPNADRERDRGAEADAQTTALHHMRDQPDAVRRAFGKPAALGAPYGKSRVEVKYETAEEMEARADVALEAADANRATHVFYPLTGAPLAVNALGGPMRDALADEMYTLPPHPSSFVTGRLQPVPETGERGIACLLKIDDGSDVWLDSFSGGSSGAGFLGALTLRTYKGSDDHTGTTRSYIAIDKMKDDPVSMEVTERVGNLETRHRVYEPNKRPSVADMTREEGTPYPKGADE